MINSSLVPADDDHAVEAIVSAGSYGAIMLAATGTAVVIALWFAFYFLVFVPRAPAP